MILFHRNLNTARVDYDQNSKLVNCVKRPELSLKFSGLGINLHGFNYNTDYCLTSVLGLALQKRLIAFIVHRQCPLFADIFPTNPLCCSRNSIKK